MSFRTEKRRSKSVTEQESVKVVRTQGTSRKKSSNFY